jgi:amidohydrolase
MSATPRVPDQERLVALRHALHAEPEVSGREAATAARVAAFIESYEPRQLVKGIGGHGMAAVFGPENRRPGEATVVLRAELDALPIAEAGHAKPYASRHPDTAHLCGHDGHMAIVAGVAPWLREHPLERGRVVLLFQPAEETGAGARAVAAEERYRALAPDWAFALHNLPGYPSGSLLVRPGALTAASVGLEIRLIGRSAHAAQPELGLNPADAVVRLVPRLAALGAGSQRPEELAMATVVHVRVGDRAFGTAPGSAEVLVTLRAASDDALAALRRAAVARTEQEAERDGLRLELNWHDTFPATVNDPAAVALVECVGRELGLIVAPPRESPFRWSEDFGWLLRAVPGAMVGLGAGAQQPPLHAPDYDFPDELLPIGVELLGVLATRAAASPPRTGPPSPPTTPEHA